MASSSTSTCSRRHSCEEEKRIIKLLLQGQKSAKQLQILLHNNRDQPGLFGTAADGFIHQILTSFTQTIHLIDHHQPNKSKPRNRSSHNYSSQNTSSGGTDKRGSYKRRRCSETRTNVSPTMEDGQAWRKYGQKVILNSNFPRSYFRCTHKYDQGCKATKQVQIMEDNPQLYQTTYIGFHTCISHTPLLKLPAPTPTMFAFSSDETPFINGQQNNNNVSTMMMDLFSSSDDQQPTTLAVKEEEDHNNKNKEQDDTMSDLTDNHNSSSFPHLLHMDLDHISHIYSFGPAFDDVTSQFDHPDFKIDDFFFSD